MSSPEIVEEGAEAAKPAAPKSKKKLIIIGAAAGVLLLGGGGGAAMMLSGGSAKAEIAAEGGHGEVSNAAEGESGHGGEGAGEAFVDVPAMVVNLRSPDGASRFLKLHFMIVPGAKGTSDGIKEKLPLILDAYQPFLRELRPEDLAGSAAVFRIKEEMLVRATDVAGPGVVKDILIQDLVQQ
ncbi:flagellar basal body-associated FliL family protein [Sphingomonas sp. UNC305MFCol5.2]|uniref:flagellar basal body-associated FliL family protein n=1 Tax=Sphingomonas sp. UNC305MFCol5.2 TaxID=1449076 RepID=UPI0004712EDC|nr:flagellar basal body-associated FliL family protein [Sphingomonas sp. UNC305MFCol5.2]